MIEDEALIELRNSLFGKPPEQTTDPEPTETPKLEPYVWPEVPVIESQAKTPTGSSQAEIERSQNLSRLFGGNKDGIR